MSQRRWSFLRAALLKKEVNLAEFSDVTKRSLADINLIEKEQGTRGSESTLHYTTKQASEKNDDDSEDSELTQ